MRGNPVTWLLVLILAAGSLVPAVARFVTDLWWFEAEGHLTPFWTLTLARWSLAAGGFALGFGAILANLRPALRLPPPVAGPRLVQPGAPAEPGIDVTRLAPLLALVVGGLVGWTADGWWDEVLLAWYGQDFGYTDPVFGLDARAYVFVLPVVSALQQTALALLVVCTLAATGAWLSRGALRVRMEQQDDQLVVRGVTIDPEAARHLGALVAACLLVVAVGHAVGRFELLHVQRALLAGPGYTAVHLTLPLMTLQAVLVALGAGAAWRAVETQGGGWALTAALLVGGPWALTAGAPTVLQRLGVEPNELNREAPYLQHHIEATRFAFGLDAVDERPLSGDSDLDRAALDRNRSTLHNVRLWDHEPLLRTFAQVQEIRPYYEFVDVDNDRYVIDGELRQVMLSPRELPSAALPREARTWVNERMTYTHGYGLALGPVDEATDQGLPTLFIQDLPPKIAKPELRIDRPELYFGEAMTAEVLVRTQNPEFDHPRGDENVYATYEGEGGVALDTWWRRAWFALRLGSTELLFSQDLTPETRILVYRLVRERVARVAPFLRLDDDPYLVIADGRLVWMLDGYTSSDRFPYSRATKGFGNYLRNPVKITVDAYDGRIRLYRTETPDPIADAWSAALPGLILPISEMPAAQRAHVRYPQAQFAVQANLYAVYHMTDHQVFYNREDQWALPVVGGAPADPWYMVMTLPGEPAPEFTLMLPFTPAGKPNLAAWMVARSDGEHYGALRVYKFPKEKMIYGPAMVMGRIQQTDTISEKVSLWNQQGSKVDLGTLLVIPIEESLLYVQPLYLQAATEGGAIPELKRVIVAHEDDIVMADTLEEALALLFGDPAVVAAPGADADEVGPNEPAPEPSTKDMDRARDAWRQARAAMTAGDWAAYGSAMEVLGQILEESP